MNNEEEKLRKEMIRIDVIGLVILFFGSGVLSFFATEGNIELAFLLAIFTSIIYSLLMCYDYKMTWGKDK